MLITNSYDILAKSKQIIRMLIEISKFLFVKDGLVKKYLNVSNDDNDNPYINKI